MLKDGIYDLPDAKLRSEDICGQSKVCDPGPRRGIVYRFAAIPFSPEIEESSTGHSIAASIIGRAVSAALENSEELNVCSSDGVTSMFSPDDITVSARYGIGGRQVKYNIKKKLQIDINAAVQSNIQDLLERRNLNAEDQDSLRATLGALYKNLNDKQLEVTATYTEWALKQSAIDRLKNLPEYQACRDKIKQNGWAVITDIGLISYNISFNGESVKRFGIDLTTKLRRKGVNADVGALINKEVHRSLTAQTVLGYQIIGWRKVVI